MHRDAYVCKAIKKPSCLSTWFLYVISPNSVWRVDTKNPLADRGSARAGRFWWRSRERSRPVLAKPKKLYEPTTCAYRPVEGTRSKCTIWVYLIQASQRVWSPVCTSCASSQSFFITAANLVSHGISSSMSSRARCRRAPCPGGTVHRQQTNGTEDRRSIGRSCSCHTAVAPKRASCQTESRASTTS